MKGKLIMKDATKYAEDCIFCKIVNKKIPVDIIKETDNFVVIKDINPVAPVHLLIISKKHYSNLLDIEDGNEKETGGNEVFGLLRNLAEEFNAEDAGFRTVINTKEDGGQTVNHLHIHFMAGRRFGWPPG
ncbi:MAG: histidine triad nucleotide-binding protein [bacterium]